MSPHRLRLINRLALWLLLVVCSGASAESRKPRVAVIVDGVGDPSSVTALVEARLSEQSVQLVDRQTIGKLLAEQYLSKTGLVDSEHAVQAGKVLAADVLAFIRTSADGNSVIVFDANSGLRLEDSATSATGAAAAEELGGNILRAIAKDGSVRSGGGGIKTICLQTVRNADLPLEKEAVGRAAGEILMRRLAGSPSIAVLERDRLSHVTQERQLTGVENALIASTISIELQIARAPDRGGILISAVLENPSQARRTSPAVQVATENPNDIANGILPQITQMLQIDQPGAVREADRIAESKRFVREVMLLWSHGEVDPALVAAEAAYALNPDDLHTGAVRARALLIAGLNPVLGGDFADPSHPIDMNIRVAAHIDPHAPLTDPAKMTLMLKAVDRASDALELLEFAVRATSRPTTAPITDFPRTALDKDPISANAQKLLIHLLTMMRYEMLERKLMHDQIRMVQLSADQMTLFVQLQGKLRHRRFELEREQLRSQIKNHGDLEQYEMISVDPMFDEARCAWSADGSAWTKDWATLIDDWVVLEKQFHTAPVASRRFGPSAPRSRIPSALLGLTFRSQAVNSYGLSEFDLKMTPQDWQRLIDAIGQLNQLPGSGAEQIVREVTMRAAPFIHPPPPAGPTTVPKDEALRRWRRTREPALVRSTSPAEPVVGKGSVWPDSRLLVDYAPGHDTKTEYGGYLSLPKIDYAAKTVYVLSHPTFGQDRRGQIELDCFNLADGARRVISISLGSGPVSELPELSYSYLNGGNAALSGGNYVYCDPFSGIYLFPLSGAPVVKVNAASAQLPSNFYQAAALLDDTLFLAVGRQEKDGYILALDLKSKALRTLASGRRVSAATQPALLQGNPPTAEQSSSPFDNASPLFVWYMQADDAAHRIVLLVSNPAWPKGLSGWWEFRPATGQFKQLLAAEMAYPHVNARLGTWVHPLKNRRIAFGLRDTPPAVLDLATGNFAPLPPVPGVPSYTGPGRRFEGNRALKYPLSEENGWIWGRFGRYRYGGSRSGDQAEIQSFDPLRKVATQWGNWPDYLEPVDADHVVVGDAHGLWYLHVPSEDAVAMGRLVQTPRPLDMPVEPVGRPPTGGPFPWSSATTIFDSLLKENVGADPPFQLLFAPQVTGENVYVLGTSPMMLDKGRVLRFSLLDGKQSQLQTVSLPYFGKPTFMSLADQASMKYSYAGSCIDGHYYYIATATDTIVAAPLDGGNVHEEKFAGTIAGLAAVDEQLFAHVITTEQSNPGARGAGWTQRQELVCIDLANGVRRTLHLNNLPPATQPSDPKPQFRLNLLRADPSRHRVVFFANGWPHPQTDFDGLWSCPVGGMPARLQKFDIWPSTGLRMGAGAYDWCGNVERDFWLLYSPNGLLRLNLATEKVERLWQVEPPGESILDTKYQFRPPIAVLDKWLWTGTLQRAALDGSTFEQLEWTRVMDHHLFEATTILPIHDGQDLLLADSCGMWIFKMKGKTGG